jgi:hypothetical protein
MGLFSALLPIAGKVIGGLLGGKKAEAAEPPKEEKETEQAEVAEVEDSKTVDMDTVKNIVTQVLSSFKKDDVPAAPKKEDEAIPPAPQPLPPLPPPARLQPLGNIPLNPRLQQAPNGPATLPTTGAIGQTTPQQTSSLNSILSLAKPPIYGSMAGF